MKRLPVSIYALIVVWAIAFSLVALVVWWLVKNVGIVQNLQQ